jgi:hypothetical protein
MVMAEEVISEIFRRHRQRRERPNGGRAIGLAEMIRSICDGLVEVKAVRAPRLQTAEARQALYDGIDALRATLRSIASALTTHAWVEGPEPDRTREELDTIRVKQMALLRVLQVNLLAALVLIAVVGHSPFLILSAVLVGAMTAAEIAILDLDPLKGFRESWFRTMKAKLPWLARLGWRLTFGPSRPAKQPEAKAHAEILVDERALALAVEDYLDKIDKVILITDKHELIDGPRGWSQDEILRFIQALSGSLRIGDQASILQTLEIKLTNLIDELGVEVISDWNPHAPEELWVVKASPSIDATVVTLPALRQGERITRGVVYRPVRNGDTNDIT